MKRSKKIAVWIAVFLGGFALLVIIAAVSLPFIINQEQIRGRIERRISRQLGGEVRFSSVEISFYPPRGSISEIRIRRPDFTGTVGALDIGFAVLPLFVGNLEMDTLTVRNPEFTIDLPETTGTPPQPSAPSGEGSPETVRENIADLLSRVNAYFPEAVIKLENGAVSFTYRQKLLYRLKNVQATLNLPPDRLAIEVSAASDIWEAMAFNGGIDADGRNLDGELNIRQFRPEKLARYFAPDATADLASSVLNLQTGFQSEDFSRIWGTLEGSAVYPEIPGPITIAKSEFTADMVADTLVLEQVQVTALNSPMTLSGRMDGFQQGLSRIDLNLSGTAEAEAIAWLNKMDYLPPYLNIAAPVRIRNGHFTWGEDAPFSFAADITTADEMNAVLDLTVGPQLVRIRKLTIDDQASDAEMAITIGESAYDIRFSGRLAEETLSNVLHGMPDMAGNLRGNFTVHFSTEDPAASRFTGSLQASGFSFRYGQNSPIHIREIAARGEGKTLRITSSSLAWKENLFSITGTTGFAAEDIRLDLLVQAEGFDYEKIQKIVEEESRAPAQPPPEKEAPQQNGLSETLGQLNLVGKVVVRAKYFKYRDLTWEPLEVVVNINNRRLGLQLTRGDLCGIETDAAARLAPDPMRLSGEVAAEDQPLRKTINCFLESRIMSGEFNVTGEISTRGRIENLLEHLQGEFTVTAEDGRIFRLSLLARVLAVVNLPSILGGEMPDLFGEGFGYNEARASGKIRDGVLTLDETYLKGKSLELAFVGNLDIPDNRINLTVLVTPLKTVDSIIEKIPIIGYLAGEHFMAIPVQVKGDLPKPDITPLPASAVGKGLLGIVERTVKLPVKVLQPFL